MANYVSHRIVVHGEPNELIRFKTTCIVPDPDDGDICLNFAVLVPEPSENTDWHTWRMINWGTKWNSCSFQEEHYSPGRYEFTFDTAWSSPGPIFDALAENYPTLEFQIDGFDEMEEFAITGCIADGMAWIAEVEPSPEMFKRVYGYDSVFDDEAEEEFAR